ncbi:SUKH-4 family immunity protein [Streptomyces sp. NPDC056835]|uniref:SUKH-4 family immunity protein n=1 Tax=Streptomyces sp. NPDC056835 TaxID=3345956 RepID=UPI00367F5455
MTSFLTSGNLIRLFDLDGIIYFPDYPGNGLNAATASFLSSVGLPHDDFFTSTHLDLALDESNPVALGLLMDLEGGEIPQTRRSWPVLGSLRTAVIAIDAQSGAVHSYPEGENESQVLHRDIESFVFRLAEFRKLRDAKSEDSDNETLVQSFRTAVSTPDPTPFADEDSDWNLILDEILDGVW